LQPLDLAIGLWIVRKHQIRIFPLEQQESSEALQNRKPGTFWVFHMESVPNGAVKKTTTNAEQMAGSDSFMLSQSKQV